MSPLQHIFIIFLRQIEEQIESMFNSKKRVKDLSAPGAAAGPAGAAATTAAVAGGLPGLGPTSAGNIQKLEMAKRLALKINAQKNLGAEAQVCQTEMKYVCAGVIVFTAKHGIPEERQRNFLSFKYYICKSSHTVLNHELLQMQLFISQEVDIF